MLSQQRSCTTLKILYSPNYQEKQLQLCLKTMIWLTSLQNQKPLLPKLQRIKLNLKLLKRKLTRLVKVSDRLLSEHPYCSSVSLILTSLTRCTSTLCNGSKAFSQWVWRTQETQTFLTLQVLTENLGSSSLTITSLFHFIAMCADLCLNATSCCSRFYFARRSCSVTMRSTWTNGGSSWLDHKGRLRLKITQLIGLTILNGLRYTNSFTVWTN